MPTEIHKREREFGGGRVGGGGGGGTKPNNIKKKNLINDILFTNNYIQYKIKICFEMASSFKEMLSK